MERSIDLPCREVRGGLIAEPSTGSGREPASGKRNQGRPRAGRGPPDPPDRDLPGEGGPRTQGTWGSSHDLVTCHPSIRPLPSGMHRRPAGKTPPPPAPAHSSPKRLQDQTTWPMIAPRSAPRRPGPPGSSGGRRPGRLGRRMRCRPLTSSQRIIGRPSGSGQATTSFPCNCLGVGHGARSTATTDPLTRGSGASRRPPPGRRSFAPGAAASRAIGQDRSPRRPPRGVRIYPSVRRAFLQGDHPHGDEIRRRPRRPSSVGRRVGPSVPASPGRGGSTPRG